MHTPSIYSKKEITTVVFGMAKQLTSILYGVFWGHKCVVIDKEFSVLGNQFSSHHAENISS